jgi:rhamnulokinase
MERGVDEGLRRCAALAPEGIRSIAVDGWAVDYVRMAADGSASGAPFCYRDDRTLAAEAAVHAHTPAAELRALTGIQIQRINTAYQLFADNLAGAPPARWLNLPEYLLYRLGGRTVAELTNASHTQLIAEGCACWSEQAFRLLGLDISLAPPIVRPGTEIGRLQGELAALPAYQDTVLIAPACHDTASAVAGIPSAEDSDWAYVSSGTWSLVGTVLDKPENGLTARAGNYTNLAAVGGHTLFHKGLNGMWLLKQCMQQWETERENPMSLPSLLEQAALVATPTLLLDVDDPDLLLHGQMPDRISNQIVRRGGDPLPQTHAAGALYANLIFHSLAARYATVLAEIQAITGKRFRTIYVVGGGSRNHFLNQLVERATGVPVVRGPAESSTQGNFAIQLATLEDGEATAPAVARWASALDRCCGTDGLVTNPGR